MWFYIPLKKSPCGLLNGGGGGIRSCSLACNGIPRFVFSDSVASKQKRSSLSSFAQPTKNRFLTLTAQNKNESDESLLVFIRRRWDSNPRYARTYDSFQDCSNQPLWHSSKRFIGCSSIIFAKTFLSTSLIHCLQLVSVYISRLFSSTFSGFAKTFPLCA